MPRKRSDKDYDSYTLGIPNREVRIELTKALIPYYVTPNTLATNNTVRNMARALDKEDLNLALQHLQTFLGTLPYCENTNYEGHYQQMIFVIFTLLTAYMVDIEVRTPSPTGKYKKIDHHRKQLYHVKADARQGCLTFAFFISYSIECILYKQHKNTWQHHRFPLLLHSSIRHDEM